MKHKADLMKVKLYELGVLWGQDLHGVLEMKNPQAGEGREVTKVKDHVMCGWLGACANR